MKLNKGISRRTLIVDVASITVLSGLGVACAQSSLPIPQSVKAPSAEATDNMARLQEKNAQAELDKAIQTFPYDVRLPQQLPIGAKMANVIAHTESYEGGETVHSLDVWYRLPSGDGLHIWQTNSSGLAGAGKDPVLDSADGFLSVGDTTWKRADTDFAGVKSFSARFSDGVTVSLDFPISLIDARVLLATVTPNQ